MDIDISLRDIICNKHITVFFFLFEKERCKNIFPLQCWDCFKNLGPEPTYFFPSGFKSTEFLLFCITYTIICKISLGHLFTCASIF